MIGLMQDGLSIDNCLEMSGVFSILENKAHPKVFKDFMAKMLSSLNRFC